MRGRKHREGVAFRGKRTPASPIQTLDLAPSPALRDTIECYWEMSWKLSSPREVVFPPTGCINLVFDPVRPLRFKIVGPRTSAYRLTLDKEGFCRGARFAPAGLSRFLDETLSLRDQVKKGCALGKMGTELEEIFARSLSAETLDRCFISHLRPTTPEIDLVQRATDQEFHSVSDLAKNIGVTPRTLQRVFSRHLHLPPKSWVRIQRVQKALSGFIDLSETDSLDLALELGYHDQAHLLRDFRSITGSPPSAFKR